MRSTLKNFLNETLSPEHELALISRAAPLLAVFGIVNHVLFFFLCSSMGYNENIYLRLLASASFIPFFYVKKNNSIHLKVIYELSLAYSLPFLFSYFYYANNLNTYWHLSLFLSGFIYGVLSGKMVNIPLIFPLSCTIAFLAYNRLEHFTTVSYFYTSLSVILLSTLSALIGSAFKVWLSLFITEYIDLKNEHDSVQENYKYKQLTNERLHLEKELIYAVRMNTLGTLSKGFATEINNSMSVVSNQISSIPVQNADQEKIQRIQRILELTRKARDLADHLLADICVSDNKKNSAS